MMRMKMLLLSLLVSLCSMTAHAAQIPLEDVTGIYGLTQAASFDSAVYDLDITGMSLRVPWSVLEPTEGNYNWSRFDTLVSECAAHGKKAKLFVMLGVNVPGWVNCAWHSGVPVPWDATLRSKVNTLIGAIANRYNSNSAVAYYQVVGPSGQWAELNLPAGLVNAPGYSNQAILDSWKLVIDRWESVRGDKRLACSVSAPPSFYTNLGNDICTYAVGATGDPEDEGVCGHNFFPQWCYLDTDFAPSLISAANQWRPKAYLGEQFWGSTQWANPHCDDYEGTLELGGITIGATFVEVYQDDLVIPSLGAIAEDYDSQMKALLDSTPPANVTNFTATPGNTQIALAWTNPTAADFAGTRIQRSTTGYPATATSGTNVYDNTGTSFTNTGLTNGVLYYYSAFAHDEVPNYASGTGAAATPTSGDTTVTFESEAANDGWILESSENSNVGGSVVSTGNGTWAVRVGDEAADQQYKSILSFWTESLPDNATIVSATLKMKREELIGTNPFTTHGTCYADIKTGAFGAGYSLAAADWEAAATYTQVATMSNPTADGNWSTGTLNANGRGAINLTARTQFKVYMSTGDNDDGGTDYMSFPSGEFATQSSRPVLEVVYH